MKKICITVSLLLISFILLTCVSVPELRQIENLVPSQAPFYIHVGNMDEFLDNIESFMEPIGLKSLIGPDSLKSKIKSTLFPEGSAIEFEAFNLKKPWGLAIIPTGSESDVLTEILIPLVNPAKDFDSLKTFMGQFGKFDLKLAGEYAVAFSGTDLQIDFPPKKAADFRELESYPKGSLSFYVNIPETLKSFGLTTDQLKKEIVSASDSDSDPLLSFINKPALAKLISDVIGLLDEIEVYSGCYNVDKTGLTCKSNLKITKGKSIDKLLAPISAYQGILNYAKYIPTDKLYSISAHFDPDFASRFGKSIYDPIIDIFKLDESDKTALRTLLESPLKPKVSEYSAAFDCDIDLSKFPDLNSNNEKDDASGAFDPGSVLNTYKNLKDAFSFDIVNVSDIKDKEQYRKWMDDIIKNPLFDSLMEKIFKKAGMENPGIGFAFEYTKDNKVGALLCDEFAFRIKAPKEIAGKKQSKEEKSLETLVPTLNAFFDNYKAYIHFANNKCYMVMSKNADKILPDLVKSDSAGANNLASALEPYKVQHDLFLKSQLGGHFSIMKLLSMLKKIPLLKDTINIKPTGKEIGIVSALRYSDGRIESTAVWNIDEIKTIYDAVMMYVLKGKFLNL
jgi:hypothetical protein